jgi:predicted DNA-binding transcriptional regulator AlpA
VTSALESSPADAQVAKRHTNTPAREPKLLGKDDICARLGISRWTWQRWVKSRQAPAPVPGIPGHPRWAVRDIEHFERGRFVGRAR